MSSRQTATQLAIGLGLFALVVYIGYIAWIGFKF